MPTMTPAFCASMKLGIIALGSVGLMEMAAKPSAMQVPIAATPFCGSYPSSNR